MEARAQTDHAAQIAERARAVIDEVARVFIGPREIIELLLVSTVAKGHVLLEGVPGVAKTTLAKAFAATLGSSYKRIQFTPDLLPADITGTYVLSPRDGTFILREGPVFANVVLGDEINRAPAKTQSALLEAMQEAQVTIEGETRILPPPFLVIATQNPVEQEGTYPLPEAQIDRFLMMIQMRYPSREDERRILKSFMSVTPQARRVLGPEEVLWLQEAVRTVHVEDELLDYITALTGFTRNHGRVFLGASPRASLGLLHAARARALLAGRGYAIPDDVKALAMPVLAHRLVLTPEAEMDGTSRDSVITEAMQKVPLRRGAS